MVIDIGSSGNNFNRPEKAIHLTPSYSTSSQNHTLRNRESNSQHYLTLRPTRKEHLPTKSFLVILTFRASLSTSITFSFPFPFLPLLWQWQFLSMSMPTNREPAPDDLESEPRARTRARENLAHARLAEAVVHDGTEDLAGGLFLVFLCVVVVVAVAMAVMVLLVQMQWAMGEEIPDQEDAAGS